MIAVLGFLAVLCEISWALPNTDPHTAFSDSPYISDFFPPATGLLPRVVADPIAAALNPTIRNAFQVFFEAYELSHLSASLRTLAVEFVLSIHLLCVHVCSRKVNDTWIPFSEAHLLQ